MKIKDNFLNEAFENFNCPTTKKFSEVFKIEQTKIGNQIIILMPIKLEDKLLNQEIIIVNNDLKINDISIFDLQDKSLVGTINKDSEVFNITGFI